MVEISTGKRIRGSWREQRLTSELFHLIDSMSNSFRFSKLLPRFLRSDKGKSNSNSDWEYGGDKQKDGHVCKVLFLDDTEVLLPFKGSSKGAILLEEVFRHLNLAEKDYFGLRYLDSSDQTHWLDNQKGLSSQLKGCSIPYLLYFGVKFYPVDPCKLKEEITRYQFYLQVKRDIVQGRLPVTFEEAAELFAYAIQSELGDYDQRLAQGYVSEFRFVPNQTEELEDTISALHKRLSGLRPYQAEHKFLDKVKWLDMYGVDLHPVMGEGNTEYFLGLTPMGIVVYKNKTKVGNYFWPRINKVTFKGKIFIIKVKDKNNDEHTYAFEVMSKLACKHLWKCCVEHHAFFRLRQASDSYARSDYSYRPTSRSRRSSGRHERLNQTESDRRQPNVNRVPSKRHQRRTSSDSRLSVHGEGIPHLAAGISVNRIAIPPPDKSTRHNRSLPDLQKGSPKSTRSAPWETDVEAGLYTSGRDSPTSMYSDATRSYHRRVGPPSDTESGYRRKHMYFPRGKGSDNESDVSFSRRRRREIDSGSESDVSPSRPHRHRPKSSADDWFESQWKEAMEGMYIPNKENMPNGGGSSVHSAPTGDFAAKRRRRRRSKSPANKQQPPEELRQHFDYNLVDTEGMTEAELQDIPFIQVETKAEPFRLRYSPKTRQRYRSPKRKSTGDLDPDPRLGIHLTNGDNAVPSYPNHDTPESVRHNYFSDTNSNYKLKSRNDKGNQQPDRQLPGRPGTDKQPARLPNRDQTKPHFDYQSQDGVSLNSHDTLRSRDFDSTTISSEQASLGVSLDDSRSRVDQKFENRMENVRGSNRYSAKMDDRRQDQSSQNNRPSSNEQGRGDSSRSNEHDKTRQNDQDISRSNDFDRSKLNEQDRGRSNYQDRARSNYQDRSRTTDLDRSRSNEQDRIRSNYQDRVRSNDIDIPKSNSQVHGALSNMSSIPSQMRNDYRNQGQPRPYNPESRSSELQRPYDQGRSERPVQYQLRSSQRNHNKGRVTPSSTVPPEDEGDQPHEVKEDVEEGECNNEEDAEEVVDEGDEEAGSRQARGPPPLPQRDHTSTYTPTRSDHPRDLIRVSSAPRGQARTTPDNREHNIINSAPRSQGRMNSDTRGQSNVNSDSRSNRGMYSDTRAQPGVNSDSRSNRGVNSDTRAQPGVNSDSRSNRGVNSDTRAQPGMNFDSRSNRGMNYDQNNQGRLNSSPQSTPKMNGTVHNQGVSTSTNNAAPTRSRMGYSSVQDRPLPRPPVNVQNSPAGMSPKSRTFGTSDTIKKLYSTPPDTKRMYATQDSIRRLYNQDGQTPPGKGVSTSGMSSVGMSTGRSQNILTPLSQNVSAQNSQNYNYNHSPDKTGQYASYSRATDHVGETRVSRGVTTQHVINKNVIPRTVLDPGHNRDLWTEI
ncbi:serine/arginine repetitive matrix protein 2-like [Ylistrum balloti]|uniref:serine/arginine repetitive matrix protein 2-like n=1 Tax=Ylistrum balloti TaxID=509963 RepID=UPI0029058F5E|nr:serine/arginine repetitive matrix protein 2-like [Ylistrum balloti]